MTDVETLLWLFNNKARLKRSGDTLSVEYKGWHVTWKYTTEHDITNFINTQLKPVVLALDHQMQQPFTESDSLTVGKLMEQLEAFPWDIEVRRQINGEWGTIEIEKVEIRNGRVIID